MDKEKKVEQENIINKTMFKDLPKGTTHSQNDGCGEPTHNSKSEARIEWIIDDIVHDLEAFDFNSEEVRNIVRQKLTQIYQAGRDSVKGCSLQGYRATREEVIREVEEKFTELFNKYHEDKEIAPPPLLSMILYLKGLKDK